LRKRRQSAPAVQVSTVGGSRYSVAALETFLEHARATAASYEARIDAVERKASTLLGFVGVTLVLLPSLRVPITKVHGSHARTILLGLTILAAVLLALSAAATATVLWPRPLAVPSLEQLRREWTAYVEQPQRTPEQLTGMLVDQLVQRGSGPTSPLEMLRSDGEKRMRWFTVASGLVLLDVLLLLGLTIALLLEGGA
jgi:hypothetical protein